MRPEEVGIAEADLERIAGGMPEENAATVERVLAGEDGAARDVVLLNAGAAILVGGGADDLPGAVERARESVDSGAAREVLSRLVEVTAAPRLLRRIPDSPRAGWTAGDAARSII